MEAGSDDIELLLKGCLVWHTVFTVYTRKKTYEFRLNLRKFE